MIYERGYHSEETDLRYPRAGAAVRLLRGVCGGRFRLHPQPGR